MKTSITKISLNNTDVVAIVKYVRPFGWAYKIVTPVACTEGTTYHKTFWYDGFKSQKEAVQAAQDHLNRLAEKRNEFALPTRQWS